METTITKSKKKDKKFDANIKTKDSEKNISFGASGYAIICRKVRLFDNDVSQSIACLLWSYSV